MRLQIDNNDFASVFTEPIEGGVAFEGGVARVPSLREITGEKFGDFGVTIDKKEFGGREIVLHFL